MRLLLPFLLFWSLYAGTEAETDPYAGIRYFQLENGLQVYMLSDAKAENTSLEATVYVGSDAEDENSYGLAHLVEHIVFRDGRVPHRDYVDYIKEEGGTYVNGFTRRYDTVYRVTIGSDKSYWIAALFAQMLFDKNVTGSDLESERGAVQTEIGDYKLPERIAEDIMAFFAAILPPREDFFADQYALEKIAPLPSRYHAKRNNGRFTLEEVMAHYRDYYYPANTMLKIAGDFDPVKMEALIRQQYGVYREKGTATTKPPVEKPKLSRRPSMHFYEGMPENSGYIGAKYLLDDYKKYLILDAYTANAAQRLQQQLRNKLGQNYDVSPYMFNERGAGVAAVSFDGLRNHFEANVGRVRQLFAADAASLDDATIDDALRRYREQSFDSLEHDSASLMELVGAQEYLRTEQGITDRTPYEVFDAITRDEFRTVVTGVFAPENAYTLVYRDYYFFPYDAMLWGLTAFVLLILVYFKLYRFDYRAKGLRYTKRDIVLERRLSNRFLGFLMFILVLIVSSVLWEWIQYGSALLLTGDPYYLETIDVPYSYAVNVFDAILMIVLFAVVYKYAFRYDARLDIDGEALYLVGNNIDVFKKSEIVSVDVTPWRPGLFFRIRGLALAFWRPLTVVTMRDGRKVYLRAGNAAHLKEDIEKSLAG